MKFQALPLAGAFVVDAEPFVDHRGYFSRAFAVEEFAAAGIDFNVVHMNMSGNAKRATLRGMHFQAAPFAEAKFVRCTAGAIWDVMADLRPESPTYRQWWGTELSADNRRALFIPQHFAHGYITLTDGAEVAYLTDCPHHKPSERGMMWNDPVLGVEWPLEPEIISDKDAAWPLATS